MNPSLLWHPLVTIAPPSALNANSFHSGIVRILYLCHHLCLLLGGFHGNGLFCLGEENEVEQDDFLSFETDLVAEQLTYMDAVSEGGQGWGGGANQHVRRANASPFLSRSCCLKG